MSNNSNYVLIGHDVGGALKLKEYADLNNLRPLCLVNGPAKDIFEGYTKLDRLSQLVLEEFKIIIGTGSSTFELDYMIFLQKASIKYSVIMDNWIYYRERLTTQEIMLEPECIYVFDRHSRLTAERIFGNLSSKIIQYKGDQCDIPKTPSLTKSEKGCENLVFISQPLTESVSKQKGILQSYVRYDWPKESQQQILKIVQKYLCKINYNLKSTFIVMHPSEGTDSLLIWKKLCESDKSVNLLSKEQLWTFDPRSVIIVGLNSSLLVELSYHNYSCFSACHLVDWACSLPQEWIVQI